MTSSNVNIEVIPTLCLTCQQHQPEWGEAAFPLREIPRADMPEAIPEISHTLNTKEEKEKEGKERREEREGRDKGERRRGEEIFFT